MKPALSGLRVLVTRAERQASALAVPLAELGAIPMFLPSIEILPPESFEAMDAALGQLERFDWVVFTSANGVSAVFERLGELGVSRDRLAARKLAVIGPATADALRQACRAPDLVPSEFVAEALLAALGDVSGVSFLLAQADLAREDLALGLVARGARVEQLVAYRIVTPSAGALAGTPPDLLTFTSSRGVRNTLERFRAAGVEHWMREIPIVCIGPVTSETVRQLGFTVAAQAKEFTLPGLIEAIVEYSTNAARSEVRAHA